MRYNYCIYLLTLTTMFFVGCATQYTSTIVSCHYDTKRNQTNYMVFPYGSVSIPNKWERTSYNSVSRQQFFKNEEGVTIAISFGPCNKYEFNTDDSKEGFAFVKAFYEWDSHYFVDTFGMTQNLIEDNETDNYIIWRLHGDYDDSQYDTYFLFGEKNGIAHSYSISDMDKWTTEQKLAFLKEIYAERNTK